jgi:hypothetical protein
MTWIQQQLYTGKNSRTILINYYSSFHSSSSDEQNNYREAQRILAFAPVEFFKELAAEAKIKLADLLELFKDWKVVKFFGKIGWSFKKLFELLKDGYNELKKLVKIFDEFIEKQGFIKWTTDKIKEFDKFLEDHPTLKRYGKYVISAILVYIWFNSAFIGIPGYDYDLSDVVDALNGKYSLTDIFGGAEGVKKVLALTGGKIGLSFIWPAVVIQFAMAVIFTIARKLSVKLRTSSNNDEIIIQSVLALNFPKYL